MREQIEMVLEQQRGCLQAGTWAARQAPREARQVPPPARLWLAVGIRGCCSSSRLQCGS